MQVVVLGGTGTIGRAVSRRAVSAGHQVTTLARRGSPDAQRPEGVTALVGDVLYPDEWSKVLQQADVVIFAVGSKGTGPTVVRSDGMANIVTIMDENPSARVVAVAPASVAISPNDTLLRRITLRYFEHKRLRNVLNDVERMEDELALSALDWTVVRCPGVRDGSATGRYTVSVGGHEQGHRPVSTADLADYLLTQALTPELAKSVVTVSGQR